MPQRIDGKKTSILVSLAFSLTLASLPGLMMGAFAQTYTDAQGRSITKEEYDAGQLVNEASQYLNQNKNAEALFRLESAVRIAPNMPDAHYNYGIALAKMGQTEEAVKQYQETTRLNPDMPFGWMNLGASYQMLGKIEEAVQAYTQFVARFPSNPEAGKVKNLIVGLNKELGRQTNLPATSQSPPQQAQQPQGNNFTPINNPPQGNNFAPINDGSQGFAPPQKGKTDWSKGGGGSSASSQPGLSEWQGSDSSSTSSGGSSSGGSSGGSSSSGSVGLSGWQGTDSGSSGGNFQPIGNSGSSGGFQPIGSGSSGGSGFQPIGKGNSGGGNFQPIGNGSSGGGGFQPIGKGSSGGGNFQPIGNGSSGGGGFQPIGKGNSGGGNFQPIGNNNSGGGNFQPIGNGSSGGGGFQPIGKGSSGGGNFQPIGNSNSNGGNFQPIGNSGGGQNQPSGDLNRFAPPDEPPAQTHQQPPQQTQKPPQAVQRPNQPTANKPPQVATNMPQQRPPQGQPQSQPHSQPHSGTGAPQAGTGSGGNAAINYLADVGGARLGKWPADRMPLRVCIVPAANVKGYQPAFDQCLIKCFQDWGNSSGGKVSFKGVSDQQAADIVCTWTSDTSKFMNSAEAGETTVYGSTAGIQHVTMQILTVPHPMSQSIPLTENRLRWICLHEIGHALGLGGHTKNPQDIMFFTTPMADVWKELTPRDCNTVQALYSR